MRKFFYSYAGLVVLISLGSQASLLSAQEGVWERRVIIDRHDYIPLCMVEDGQGGYLVGGQSRRVDDQHWYGMVMSIDAQMKVRWTLVNRSDTVGNISMIKPLADGRFVALNNFWFGQGAGGWAQAGLTWIKFDLNGQIMWHKSERSGVTALPTGVDILENSQGELITLGYHQQPLSVNKLSADGTVLWHPFGSVNGFFQASAIAQAVQDEFFIIGSSSSSRHNNINRGLIIKMADQRGPKVVWAKNYLTDVDVNFLEIFPAGKTEWFVYGKVIPGGHMLARINDQGEVLWAKSYLPGLLAYEPKDAAVNRQGEVVMLGAVNNKTVISKVNSQGELIWSRQINTEEGTMRTLLINAAGEPIVAGVGFKYHLPSDQGFDFYLTRVDGEGRIPHCISQDQPIQIKEHHLNIVPPDFQATGSDFSFFRQDAQLILDRPVLRDSLLCSCNTTALFNRLVCSGDSILIGGRLFAPPAKANLIFTNQYGCDSLLFIDIKTGNGHFKTRDTLICAGDTLWVEGLPYTQSAQIDQHHTNVSGCDSLIQLTLNVAPVYNIRDTAYLCAADTLWAGLTRITAPGEYRQLLRSQQGCDSMVNLSVLFPAEESKEEFSELSVPFGQTMTLESCVTGVKYVWSPATALSCVDCHSPQLLASGTVNYSVRVWSSAQCPTVCRYLLKVADPVEDLYVANIFSPNGDGQNDFFLPSASHFQVMQLAVYDRSGALLYQEIMPTRGWDGARCHPGVYIYQVQYQNKSDQKMHIKQGEITLVR